MTLARGAQVAEYFFERDDEAPMPEPHTAVSARIHPPPPKQLRASAVSVPMAKSIEKAIAADPRQYYPKGMHPYKQLDPQAKRLAVPATERELAALKPPAVSAQPKPAKGCNRISSGIGNPLNEKPWPMPAISNGFDNVGDGAPWRQIAVAQNARKPWPL